ncbi:SRPBCC family protein [Sinomonas sp. JGH33]|uniref:SRPBCC family protein n=1 Tax=Sinomonas terricola TaxID=3110330 RepID=A0ABU5T6N9_9MICC|nr:SRPBCC family protein [Sinomonas sp. JGH33]MEA5455187.1 SRPBCC family protein [Sinomonas sp. JGH33]
MLHAEHTFRLPVPPAEAFALLGDPSRDDEWQSSVIRSRLLDPGPAPGSRYEIAFHMLGQDLEFVAEITAFEPGVRSGYRTVSGPFSYEGGYTYAAADDGGTDVAWHFAVDPGRFFGLLPASFMRWVLISQVEKDAHGLAERLAADQGTAHV